MIFFIKKSLIVLLVFGLNLEAADRSLSPLGDSDTISVSSHDLQFFLDDAVVAPLPVDKKIRKELHKKLILNDQCLACKINLSQRSLYYIVEHYGLKKLAKPASDLKKKDKLHIEILNTLQADSCYAPIIAQFERRREQEYAAKLAGHTPRISYLQKHKQDFLAELVDMNTKKCLLCPYVFSKFAKYSICAHYGIESLFSRSNYVKTSVQSHLIVLKALQDSGKYSDVFKTQREYVLEKKLRCSKKREILRSHKLLKDDAAEHRLAKRPCMNSAADTTV